MDAERHLLRLADDGRFTLNEAGAALRSDAAGATRDIVINLGEEMYRAFVHPRGPRVRARRSPSATTFAA